MKRIIVEESIHVSKLDTDVVIVAKKNGKFVGFIRKIYGDNYMLEFANGNVRGGYYNSIKGLITYLREEFEFYSL